MSYTEPANVSLMLKTIGMGLGVVFVGLICIIAICFVMSVLVRRLEKKPVPEEKPSEPMAASHGELSAAIAVAVAEALGTNPDGIRIVSIKKI